MSFAIPVKEAFLSSDVRAVLDFFGVQLDVIYVGNRFFEVTLQFRNGTVRKFYLDFASLLVRRSVLNVLSTVMNPLLYRAFYSRLNHRFISGSSRLEGEADAFVALTTAFLQSNYQRYEDTAVGASRAGFDGRIIPLPYKVDDGDRLKHPKRRRTTLTSFLGESYFVCKHCFKSFNRKSNMTRHIDRTHCGRVVFNCPQCPAVYKHAYHFADHLRGHEESPQFECDNCEKKFKSRIQLRNHKRRNCADPPKESHCGNRRSRTYDPQECESSAGQSWRMAQVKQFSRIDLNGFLPNIVSTSGIVAGMSLTGTLPLESVGSLTNECPPECLTTLTAYTDSDQGSVVMLRPGDIGSYAGFSTMKLGPLYCAVSQGHCGADVPLYLMYSDKNRDYYIALRPATNGTYSVQYSGEPLCFLWADNSSTTTTTVITSTVYNYTSSIPTELDNITTSTASENATPAEFDNTSLSTISTWNDTTTTSIPLTSASNSSDLNTTTTASNLTTTTLLIDSNYTTITLVGNLTSVSSTTMFSTTVPEGNTTSSTITTTTVSSSITTASTNTSTTTRSYKKKIASLSSWPLILAGFVGVGVLVLTVLALSTLSVVRSGKRALIRSSKSSTSPPPPYPYIQDPSSELPPAPVTAMAAPQTFSLNTVTTDIPLHTMSNYYG